MKSTGPILAIGATTMISDNVFQGRPINWRVPIATGLAIGAFALMEHAWEQGTVAVAWLALFTTLFVGFNGHSAPVETALIWWSGKPIQHFGPVGG